MRHRLLVAAVLLSGACFRSSGGGGGGGDGVLSTSGPAQAEPDFGATLADPLGFLPIDSELVLGLDAAQLRASALWQLLEPRILAQSNGSLELFQARCGFDLVPSIRGVTLGLRNVSADRPEGVIVVAGLDRTKLMACLEDAAKTSPGKVVVDGRVVIFHGDHGRGGAAQFVDGSTLVFAIGPAFDRDVFGATLRAGAPLRSSPAFMEMWGRINAGDALWMLINGNAKLLDKAAAMGFRPKAVFGSVSVARGLAANLRVRLDDPATATNLAAMAQGQLGMAASFFDQLEVAADDVDLVVTAAMTDQQVQSLASMLGGVIP